jgi:hypothetical protein
MNTYSVLMIETIYKRTTVLAENEKEARETAFDSYCNETHEQEWTEVTYGIQLSEICKQ